MLDQSADRPTDSLPDWKAVRAVVAHPDDESFGLGAILDTFARSGAVVSVLCLTQGEASTVQGVSGDLRTLRSAELQKAARALGVASAVLRDYPDGGLAGVEVQAPLAEVVQAAERSRARGLVRSAQPVWPTSAKQSGPMCCGSAFRSSGTWSTCGGSVADSSAGNCRDDTERTAEG